MLKYIYIYIIFIYSIRIMNNTLIIKYEKYIQKKYIHWIIILFLMEYKYQKKKKNIKI